MTRELAVGERFPGASFPRPDAGEYLYYDAGHELRVFWPAPNAREVRSVRSGRAEFGLLYEEDLVSLAYRFGREPVFKAIYSWHLVPEERGLLAVILTDAAAGTVRAPRGVTFSPGSTRPLHGRLREQAPGPPAGVGEYERRRARMIQAKCPINDALMAACEVRASEGA